jgi:hypothetical protein
MEKKRFTVIRGGRNAPAPAVEHAIDLDWVPRDRWRRSMELRRGDEVMGVLRREGIAGYRAIAETPDTTWLLTRAGIHMPRTRIQHDGMEIGSYQDGELFLTDGSRFRYTHGRWTDRSGRVLLRDRGDRLRIEPAGLGLPERVLLALLGEYLKQVETEPPEER